MVGVNVFMGLVGLIIFYILFFGLKSLCGYVGVFIFGGVVGGFDGMVGLVIGLISRNLFKEFLLFIEKVIECMIGFGVLVSGLVINSFVSGEYVFFVDIGKISVVD